MPWLNYSDDEVQRFHPIFQEAADRALELEGLNERYHWEHHIRVAGSTIIPDFVLRETATSRWVLAVEIKRSSSSIFSTRHQIQAKSYAEDSSDLYRQNFPKYFAISNLESTILFALKETSRPYECRLVDGTYEIGLFANFTEDIFKNNLTTSLRTLVLRVIQNQNAEFDEVWGSVISEFLQYSELMAGVSTLGQPDTPNWGSIRNYYCHPIEIDAARVFLLRCLLGEYISGILERFQHPAIQRLLPLRHTPINQIGDNIANVFSRILEIDFRPIFETDAIATYRSLTNPEIRQNLSEYIRSIVTAPSNIRDLARRRMDRSDFLDNIKYVTNGDENLDERGKVPTDPELATLLAYLTLDHGNCQIIDPCCGDGILLEAAYNRLNTLDFQYQEIIGNIVGIEVDPILYRLSLIRILLKEPSAILPDLCPDIFQGDMFSHSQEISEADVILMNPPFKRYESQDAHPVPNELKTHYANSIHHISGQRSIALTGQQNLYTYYIEYVIRSAREGCIVGIILDNKWYHNKSANPLKKMLLENGEIIAIIEYPFSSLFSRWTIATSILIYRKTQTPSRSHCAKFVRCSLDLSQINFNDLEEAYNTDFSQLSGWTSKEIPQASLKFKLGWKNYFSTPLLHDFKEGLVVLPSLFEYSRRGSLAKEEGGIGAISFPFSRHTFGSVRMQADNPSLRNRLRKIRDLNNQENASLRELALAIPDIFKGFALEKSNIPSSYILNEETVLRQPTIEPPILRSNQIFWRKRKTAWTRQHVSSLSEIQNEPQLNAFLSEFRNLTGLNEGIMPDERLLISLREPYAGELIIPRKLRKGHRVHINPFAFATNERQVRLSSNFISLTNCTSVNPENHLDRPTAVRLISAFLLSSFGHLQFEMEGYNREGARAIEEDHLRKIYVIDPRTILENERQEILELFELLPYPIPTHILSSDHGLEARNTLDEIFARIICRSHPDWIQSDLLEEVHHLLDEYLSARSP